MATKTKTATRQLQVQYLKAPPNEREWVMVDIPVELDADTVIERIGEFVPAAGDVPADEWTVTFNEKRRLQLQQTPDAQARSEHVAAAKQQLRYELEKATTSAYAREFGIPDGYHYGEKRRLVRDIKCVIPVRYSDGAEGTVTHVKTLDVTYRVGQRERLPFRVSLSLGGAEQPWPGTGWHLTPAELEARFGDQVSGVPEIHWPYTIELDVPSPASQLQERKRTEARGRFIPNRSEALPAHELRQMGVSEEEIRAIWG